MLAKLVLYENVVCGKGGLKSLCVQLRLITEIDEEY